MLNQICTYDESYSIDEDQEKKCDFIPLKLGEKARWDNLSTEDSSKPIDKNYSCVYINHKNKKALRNRDSLRSSNNFETKKSIWKNLRHEAWNETVAESSDH